MKVIWNLNYKTLIVLLVVMFALFTNTYNALAQTKLVPLSGDYVYFSAFADFDGTEDNVTKEKITNFENLANKKIAIAEFSQNWLNGITYPKESIHTIKNEGVFPIMRIMPRSDFSQEQKETVYSLQKIIDGEFDTQLHKMAIDARKDGIPFGVDFAVEPTGDWFGWSGIFNGAGATSGYGDPDYPDGPERWRDAYRHIIDIFRSENVMHVTWFFHPDIQRIPDEQWNSAKYYYPGDDYIDWIGISVYGAQIPIPSEEWILFSELLEDRHELITEISDKKPFCVLEFGVTDNYPGESKSAWLEDAFETILDNPYIDFKVMNYWHENWENEDTGNPPTTLRIDSTLETLEKFKNLINNSRFVSNVELSSDLTPIFRLYNKRTGTQLYTRGVADKDKILAKFKDFEFTDRTPAFYASLTEQPGLTPIFRLYNKRTGAQLYTRGEADKNKILNKFRDFEFTDGVPAFYTSLSDDGTTPIFRLYNRRTGMQLYTRGVADKDKILTKYKDFEFTDGAPAFYASLTN